MPVGHSPPPSTSVAAVSAAPAVTSAGAPPFSLPSTQPEKSLPPRTFGSPPSSVAAGAPLTTLTTPSFAAPSARAERHERNEMLKELQSMREFCTKIHGTQKSIVDHVNKSDDTLKDYVDEKLKDLSIDFQRRLDDQVSQLRDEFSDHAQQISDQFSSQFSTHSQKLSDSFAQHTTQLNALVTKWESLLAAKTDPVPSTPVSDHSAFPSSGASPCPVSQPATPPQVVVTLTPPTVGSTSAPTTTSPPVMTSPSTFTQPASISDWLPPLPTVLSTYGAPPQVANAAYAPVQSASLAPTPQHLGPSPPDLSTSLQATVAPVGTVSAPVLQAQAQNPTKPHSYGIKIPYNIKPFGASSSTGTAVSTQNFREKFETFG